MRLKKGPVVFALVLFIIGSGCLGTQKQGNNTITSSSASNSTVTFPNKVVFSAMLTIRVNNTTIKKYSYDASLDYLKMNAQINFTSVYRPGFSGLTGNWHSKRIVIENGSSVRMYMVPPAMWMPVPENQTKKIVNSVFHFNPYVVIFNSTSKDLGCSQCSVNVTLSPEASTLLLAQFVGADNAPHVPLEGTIMVKGSIIVSAKFTGVFDGRIYNLSLEVKEP